METASVLVATLGGQPQVVTFALDALLALGEHVREVVVVHHAPATGRLRNALLQLAAEFPGDRYLEQPCRFRSVPLGTAQGRLEDIRNEHDVNATWLTLHDVLRTLKEQERRVHLCLAGGRRLMSLLSLSVAMLHLGHHDRVWHLYTPDELRERASGGAVMHVQPQAGVRLIQVPLAPWGAYFPGLRALLATSPGEVLSAQRRQLDAVERERCEKVVKQLTERQQAVLRAFAAGAQPQEVAERLYIALTTVNTHKTQILAECRVAWGLPEKQWLDYRFLHDKFGRYFESTQ